MTAPYSSDHARPRYRVCWASVINDSHGHGHPMVRDLAEFVAHDEALAQPMRHVWIEVCAEDEEEDDDDGPMTATAGR